jgi:hypothetical protein
VHHIGFDSWASILCTSASGVMPVSDSVGRILIAGFASASRRRNASLIPVSLTSRCLRGQRATRSSRAPIGVPQREVVDVAHRRQQSLLSLKRLLREMDKTRVKRFHFQSFPRQLFEIADVSLVEGTIASRNDSFFFGHPEMALRRPTVRSRSAPQNT